MKRTSSPKGVSGYGNRLAGRLLNPLSWQGEKFPCQRVNSNRSHYCGQYI